MSGSPRPVDPPSTEDVHPDSRELDMRSAREIVDVLHREDLQAWAAVEGVLDTVAALAEDIAASLRRGGRLIYAGAGSSGRLGVLDAAECPPTFGVEPGRVEAVIAGGAPALVRAVEGAEDSREDGARAIALLGTGPTDVVCGIAASGRTPYVLAALEEAARRGARTALITSNTRLAPDDLRPPPDRSIVLAVGPEVLAGSTRMKCGTATKMVLNMLTTTAMVRWGRVFDNLMVDLVPANEKLRRRAVRLVERLAGVDRARAQELLGAAGGRVKVAVVMARRGLARAEAERLLDRTEGFLRRALEEPAEGEGRGG